MVVGLTVNLELVTYKRLTPSHPILLSQGEYVWQLKATEVNLLDYTAVNSWRRDIEAELKQQGTNWSGMTRAAQNRVRWQGVVDGLCSTGSDGHK